MEKVKNVVAITPCWNEPLGLIQKFESRVQIVREELASSEIGFRHFFLDDGALHLSDEDRILVRHRENLGLAQTLIDGYKAVLDLKSAPDVVVRLDCQEHDPTKILDIVENMARSDIDVLFLPVWYWVEGEPRPLMREISVFLAEFTQALSPVNEGVVLATYNQKFPMGFQAFRTSVLRRMFPTLEHGVRVCEEITHKPATWGLDLLSILLAAYDVPERTDFIFGGWSEPWRENRGIDKIEAQQEKAKVMVEVAGRLLS